MPKYLRMTCFKRVYMHVTVCCRVPVMAVDGWIRTPEKLLSVVVATLITGG